jgi:hypothetical protein
MADKKNVRKPVSPLARALRGNGAATVTELKGRGGSAIFVRCGAVQVTQAKGLNAEQVEAQIEQVADRLAKTGRHIDPAASTGTKLVFTKQ